MDFDVLVIGGGAAGLSCALLLGSALEKPFARDKKVGIIMHQKASHLNTALLNNVLGIPAGTEGKDILDNGQRKLQEIYPKVVQIQKEKVLEIAFAENGFQVRSNKNTYSASMLVVAVGYTSSFTIKGLEKFTVPHQKAKPSKNRIQLINEAHLVAPGLYVAGSLAGWRSQFAIAAGSGASVATDILSIWNGQHTKVHDKLK